MAEPVKFGKTLVVPRAQAQAGQEDGIEFMKLPQLSDKEIKGLVKTAVDKEFARMCPNGSCVQIPSVLKSPPKTTETK